jgi:phosphate transport system protein
MLMNGYDRSLHQLKERATRLSFDVSQMLERALRSLYTQDAKLAQAVLRYDDVVDDATNQLEEDSLQLISIQQPRQKDLRVLAAALRNARDLERIADYSCDIAKVTEILADSPYFMALQDLEQMGVITMDMVAQAIQAVCTKDAELARQVAARDDFVDNLYRTIHETLMDAMRHDSRTVDQASHLSLVARYLERIADHAVNIAEMAVFVETGERRPFRYIPPMVTDAKG